ncbi:hypothetical protein SDC9_190131 [bioreactor metagenome]|uniref:Uncharacterized protein n=1 Tax=bioreactor metagenome TaxID=1076179 RepID=A0A645I280_9ZZZZ
MVDLRRLQLGGVLGRDGVDHRLEALGEPLVGDDRLVEVLLAGAGPVGVEVVQQPTGLVLLGVQAGQPHQPAGVVAGVDHLRLDPDRRPVQVGGDVQLGDVETERVEAAHPALDAVHLAAVELLGAGQFVPQLPVAGDDGVDQLARVEGGVQHAAGLEVEELAEQVDPGDLEVVLALPVRQPFVELAGLGVHQVGGEVGRVAAEQRVRQ